MMSSKNILMIATGFAGAIGTMMALRKSSKEKDNSQRHHETNKDLPNDTKVNDSLKEADIVWGASAAQGESEFVNTINTIRLNQLFKRLGEIDVNQKNANAEIAKLKNEIKRIITINRGGNKGMHGFIGESCQVHIANVKSYIKGEKPLYVLLDDNSMTDYMRGMQLIQQKACQSDNHLGLDHIRRHLENYPEFYDPNCIYQIPKDFYAKFEKMKNTPADVALKFRKEDLRLWKAVQSFIADNPDVKIEPMEVSYADIQVEKVNDTISDVEKRTTEDFEKQKYDAQKEYTPNVKELLRIATVSALIEGTVEAAFTLGSYIISGKGLGKLDKKDRLFILKRFFIGFIRGGIRASAVYALTNITKISSTVATTITTIFFTLTRNTYDFIKRKKNKAEYIKQVIWDALEVVVSACGAALGKKFMKKHSVIGALLGSVVFTSGFRCLKRCIV